MLGLHEDHFVVNVTVQQELSHLYKHIVPPSIRDGQSSKIVILNYLLVLITVQQ
jgi:hypothetical protein